MDDKKILGHVVRDNGTYSLWRGGTFEPPGTHGGGRAAVNKAGDLFKPVKTGIKFGDIGTALQEFQAVNPNAPENITGTIEKANGILEDVAQNIQTEDNFYDNFAAGYSRPALAYLRKIGVSQDIMTTLNDQISIVNMNSKFSLDDEDVDFVSYVNHLIREEQRQADEAQGPLSLIHI